MLHERDDDTEKPVTYAFLVQGSVPVFDGRTPQGVNTKCPITGKAVLSCLHHTQFIYGIPVLWARGATDTVEILSHLYTELQNPAKWAPKLPCQITVSGGSKRKRDSACNRVVVFKAQLAAVAGFSPAIASDVAAVWLSWRALLKSSVAELAALKLSNGKRLGPKAAERLWDTCCAEK